MGMFRCYIFTENRGCKFNKVQIRARVLTTFQLKKKKGDKADIRATNIRLQGHKRPSRFRPTFKDKMLLMQAQENGAVLDEEQSSFLAGEQVTNVDDDVDDSTENDLALNVDHIFEADECDAFDSDVDEDHMDEYHDVHEMQNDVQHNYVVDSDADYTSDSNIIPYDQYVEDNEEHVVQCNASSVRNDALMSILDEMHEHGVQSRLTNKPDMLINDSVTSELARYKELETSLKSELHSAQILLSSTVDHYKSKTEEVKLLKKDFKQKEDKFLEEFLDLKKIKDKIEDRFIQTGQSAHTVHICVKIQDHFMRKNTRCNTTKTKLQSAVYNGHMPVTTNHTPTVIHDSEDTREIAEITRKRMLITPSGLTEGERGFEQTKRCYLTEVIPFFKTLKEHFVGVQTALFKEVKEMEKIFDQMNNEVDQNSVDKQLYVAKSRCLDLEADVSKVHDESKLISKLEREYLNLQKRKGVNDSTEASGSKPRSNTKKNRILPAKKENKKEVEVRLRTNNHEMCVVNILNSVNVTPTVRIVLNKTKQIWKPKGRLSDNSLHKTKRVWKATGKLFTDIGYQWRPTGTKLTLGKLDCGSQWRPTGKKFALGEICHLTKLSVKCCSKHMTGNRSKLMNFVEKFIGSVRFGNDHLGAIMGYGDYVMGDSVISRVYYVEGLGHNLFSVGQFCDSDLEVAFRKHTCFVRDIKGTDILKGSRGTNLYTISIDEMMKSSPICLLSKASKSKSWLWHRRLNHLNFGTINDLARKDLVRGLPRLKFEKDHLCSACQLGKSKKFSHRPKSENTNMEVLHTLHMDLCGPMRVQSIKGKKYILVIVDDYSRFTWVKFLRSKDETPEFVTNFLKQIQVGLNKTVRFIRTDNGTEFVNQVMSEYYEGVGIFHQKSVPRTPQQKGIRVLVRWASLGVRVVMVVGEGGGGVRGGDCGVVAGDRALSNDAEQFSSGLIPNQVHATNYVLQTDKDLELLFQPMFDEYFEVTRVDAPVPSATTVNAHVVPPGTFVSTPFTQDAPPTSFSPSSSGTQPPVIQHDVVVIPTIEDTLITQATLHPSNNPVIREPGSAQPSSGDVTIAEPNQVNKPPAYLRKWSKDHPLGIISCQTSKNFKWRDRRLAGFKAMQGEIHEFDGLTVRNCTRLVTVMVIALSAIYNGDGLKKEEVIVSHLRDLRPANPHPRLSSKEGSLRAKAGTKGVISLIGPNVVFLRIQVFKNVPKASLLNQAKYALQTLKEIWNGLSDPVDTTGGSIEMADDLLRESIGPRTRFRGMVGSQMYIMPVDPTLLFVDNTMSSQLRQMRDHAGCQDSRRVPRDVAQFLEID
ncbi:retrovirus-related pol polyprotein from transposon TNT 1-94 [Tanacetum coccineum]